MATQLNSTTVNRPLVRRIRGHETSDGAGVRLRRLIASPELDMLDPFLLLDTFRSDEPDDYIAGFPPHPHRGFETVTYLLAGRMRHRDSAGHEGVIEAGGVQWMTAGSGIEHSEMPEQENGLLEGFQLWVNLPARDKMRPPRYQEFTPAQIPSERRDNGIVLKVVAGTTSLGTAGAVRNIAAEPLYLDVTMERGGPFEEPLPPGHNAFLYLIAGTLRLDGEELNAGELGLLGPGDRVAVASEAPARFLLVAGRPFAETVARHGPFVMNSQEEIRQAFEDYRAGNFGHIAMLEGGE